MYESCILLAGVSSSMLMTLTPSQPQKEYTPRVPLANIEQAIAARKESGGSPAPTLQVEEDEDDNLAAILSKADGEQ